MSGPEDTRREERRGISNSHQENILQNTFATTMFITFALKVFTSFTMAALIWPEQNGLGCSHPSGEQRNCVTVTTPLCHEAVSDPVSIYLMASVCLYHHCHLINGIAARPPPSCAGGLNLNTSHLFILCSLT